MRKVFIVGFVLLFVCSQDRLSAQYAEYYYHRTGDTIEQDSPIYFHAWWDWEAFRLSQEDAVLGYTYDYIFGGVPRIIKLTYFQTTDTLKVIGIAGLERVRRLPWEGLHNSWNYSSNDTLYLYDYDTSGAFVQRARIVRDTGENIHRYINIRGNGWWYGRNYTGRRLWDFGPCCHDYPWDTTFALFEYYFDSAVYVVDSFYVGNLGKCLAAQHHGLHYVCDAPPYSADCHFPHQRLKTFNVTWRYDTFPEAMMIWPIIAIDTTVPPAFVCLPLENLTLSTVDTFSAVISWDTFPQYTAVELRYAPATALSDSLPVQWDERLVTDTNVATLTGLSSTEGEYVVLARAVCDTLKRSSPWSDTLYITLPRDIPPPPCLAVDSLAVVATDTFLVVLRWADHPEAQAIELSFGPADTVRSPWQTAILSGASVGHTLVLADTAVSDYAFTARALCDTATGHTSPWSDTLYVTLPRDTAGLGITPASAAARIALVPNPASGEVLVVSNLPLHRVELHNAAGTRVYSAPAAGLRHTIPLTGLAAGIYMVSAYMDNRLEVLRLSVH